MVKRVTCRRVIRPQFGEYRAHNPPEDDGQVSMLKWQLLGVFCLGVILLGGFGYTYAYFADGSGNDGNVFPMAGNEDILEAAPGLATVYEPDPSGDKEKVAQFNDDGTLRLDFGIIHDEGIKHFKDVLRIRNKIQKPLNLEVELTGPISEVVAGWEKNITLAPGPMPESDSGAVNSTDIDTEVSEAVYGKPGTVSAAVYGLATVEEMVYGSGKKTEWRKIHFLLKGGVVQGTYTGTLVLTGMNGYLRMEIPVTVTVADKMEKNVPGQPDQKDNNISGDPPGQGQEQNESGTSETTGQTENTGVSENVSENNEPNGGELNLDTQPPSGDNGSENIDQTGPSPDSAQEEVNVPGNVADSPAAGNIEEVVDKK